MFRENKHKKYCPPSGRPGGFPHRSSHRPGLFRPLMSMSKESFMEMRKYFVLKILTDNIDGITAYQLQEEYHFPRTNVIRMLDLMETDGFVKAKEEIIDGRTNKIYSITKKGIKQMEELKEKWGERFRMMSDTTMPYFARGEKHHFMRKINEFKSSEDALDYFRGVRSKIKSKQASLEERLKVFNDFREEMDELINIIEKDKEFDREKIKTHVEDWWEKQKKEREETKS